MRERVPEKKFSGAASDTDAWAPDHEKGFYLTQIQLQLDTPGNGDFIVTVGNNSDPARRLIYKRDMTSHTTVVLMLGSGIVVPPGDEIQFTLAGTAFNYDLRLHAEITR